MCKCVPLFFHVQSESAWHVKAAAKVDDLLESFMGIRDMELGECPRSSHVSQWTLYCTLVWYDCRMCSCAWCVCPLSASLLPPLFPLSLPPSLSFLPPYSLPSSLYPSLPRSPFCLLTPSSLPFIPYSLSLLSVSLLPPHFPRSSL